MSPRDFMRLAARVHLLPVLENGDETLIGGQAVVEGVMMRSPHAYSVAVRKPNGDLVTQEGPLAKVSEKYPVFRFPLLRGLGTLGQAMWLGIKALRFSANAALDVPAEPGRKPAEVSSWLMGLNLAFSFAFFIFLYKYVPLKLTSLLEKNLPSLHGRVLFNLTDGLIRIVIFIGFLYLISRWQDIRRVFEYHGAEHRVVFNYESGQEVTVANAQKFPTFHPRCGTSFLMVVMVIAIIVYTVVPGTSFAVRMATRVGMLPVIAGVSYEVIRFAARRRGSLLASFTAPGLWMQRITTQPPSDDQTAVAIHALNGAMALEAAQGGSLVIA